MFTSLQRLIFASTLLTTASFVQASHQCDADRVSLQVLGSGGPEFTDNRASSSYLIKLDNRARILLDTGAGSGINFEKSGAKIEDLDAILFSHLHVDHSADLPAFIKASFFTPRRSDLLIYGPAGNRVMPSTTTFIRRNFGPQGSYSYLQNFVEPDQRSAYKIQTTDVPLTPLEISNYTLNDDFSLQAIPVNHGPIAATAWRVNIAGCSISFTGDMSNQYDTFSTLAKGSDIIVAHNAVPESAFGVAARLHMLPSDIGKIAGETNPQKLVISHRMNRSLGKEAQTEAEIRKQYNGDIIFANDLDIIQLEP